MDLGRLSYQSALKKQSQWIECERSARTDSCEVFFFESEPVITMGLRAKTDRDILRDLTLPILPVDRGGEATYHGPGQLLIFPSIYLPHWKLSVRRWVALLLDVTVEFLNEYDIPSGWSETKPGLFTPNGKIASIGLKIKNGWSHHGLSLNVQGNLEPFSSIRACGVANASLDQMNCWYPTREWDFNELGDCWQKIFEKHLPNRFVLSK